MILRAFMEVKPAPCYWFPCGTQPKGEILLTRTEDGKIDLGIWDGEWTTEFGNGLPAEWRPLSLSKYHE